MANTALGGFIDANRDELIGRCRAKVAQRTAPPATPSEIDRGVPMFLSQLSRELSYGRSETHDIGQSALEHGRDLLARGYTIGQVVHDYGDVCQSITDLAVETHAPISAEDYRTLNRCLDDAIAGAVTEFTKEQDSSRAGAVSELANLVNAASTAFEVLQSGTVGLNGATGRALAGTLANLRAYVEHREVTKAATAGANVVAPVPGTQPS
jgi:hypothetical protein